MKKLMKRSLIARLLATAAETGLIALYLRDFGLNIEKKDCVLEELFNNYEGVPYEGIALYKLTIGEDVRQAFLQWERFPFSEKAECFLESLSAYAELPPIADGYWKMRS